MQLPTRIPLLLLASALSALAQSDPPPPRGEVVELSRFEVTGIPFTDSVNPLVRPLEGVFGDARNILETPRAVTSITSALLRERGIEGVREFVAYVPGASAPAAYGKATTPMVRGDLAEMFINGQRRSYNNFGYFPSFNAIEAVEVVRGPGSAVYGSGFFTGGLVNYVTKQPQFTPATTLTARIGTWVPGGGSWLNGSWQIDTTAPMADGRSAWRFSYEGKEDDTFFRDHGARDDRHDIFASWIRHVSDTVTLEANAQYLWQASPQLLGVNRPNQDLMDHGIYYTGDSEDLPSGPGPIPASSTVTIPRDATLFSPGDFSNANVVHAQLVATAEVAPDRKWINRTLVEHVNRRRYHSFEYAEWATQWTAENRTEWHAVFETGGLDHSLIAGGALRWEQRESYTNYFNEYFFQYDLTRPNRVFSHIEDYPSSYYPGLEGPAGRLFFPASAGSPETVHSTLWNPALFVQDEIDINERFSFLGGLRLDGYMAKAHDPLVAPGDTPWADSHDETALSWNGSLIYELSSRASVYATYQRAYAVLGNVAGGGLILSDEQINPEDFKNLSRLAEVGAKFALRENTLYAGFALYEQRRNEVDLGGGIKNLKIRGGEVEVVYQPHARLNATFNVAYTDGRFDNSTASQAGGPSIYDLYAEGRGPDGLGTGLGPSWDKVPPGDYRITGLSRWVVNSSASYRLENGFGGGFGASWQSEQPGNLLREYHIPAQIFLNAFLFYRTPTWEVNVDVLNVLDRRNWIHNGDNFSNNVLVFQDLPRRVEAYFKYRF